MSAMPPPAPSRVDTSPEDEAKSPWYRRAWVGWIGGILVGSLFGIAGAGGSPDEADVSATGVEPRPAETVTVTATPTAGETITVEAEPQPAETVTVKSEPQPAETVTVEAEPAPAETVTVTETATPEPPQAGGNAEGIKNSYAAGQFSFDDVQLRSDFVDDFEIRARVTNDGDAVSGVSWTVTLFSDGSVVGTASGFASDLEAGSTTTQTFISTDDFTEGVDALEFQIDAMF